MKKRIAVFANTWNNDIVTSFIEGYSKAIEGIEADTFIFLAANSYGRSESSNQSELSIHSFPDLNDYDAAIVFSQGLNSNAARDLIYDNCEKAEIPTFCIGDTHPGFHGILVDAEAAMHELCEHLYKEHNVRKVAFFAGPKENGDSQKRLNAVLDFAKEHKDFILEEKDIVYTNWEIITAMNIISSDYNTKEKLPDAMIFANDILAVAGCRALEMQGLMVPDDVFVTGYDYSKSNQSYYPSIATVDQCYGRIGELIVENLIQIFAGEKVPEEQYIDGVFRPGESCGCDHPRNEDVLRRKFCHDLLAQSYEMNARNGTIFGIRSAFLDSNRFATLPGKLQKVIREGFFLQETETFYLMLDPTLERIGKEEIDQLPKYKYSDRMLVIVSKKDGEMLRAGQTIHKRELIPDYDGKGPNEIYFVMPLYIETFIVGYFIMVKSDNGMRDWVYQEYESCLVQSLTYYRTNIKLTALNDKLSELMQTDALTSLKNRTAFENAKSSLKGHYLAQDGVRFAAVMFDLNNLKKINDEYGHGAGDIYIKNSSELICHTFKHSPVFRIGGDEFVAILRNSDYEERHELLEKFRSGVQKMQADDITELNRVSVASGMADYDEIENDDIDTLFKKADERMYENKRLMKAGRA